MKKVDDPELTKMEVDLTKIKKEARIIIIRNDKNAKKSTREYTFR